MGTTVHGLIRYQYKIKKTFFCTLDLSFLPHKRFYMMIRKERAEFLDNLLKVFDRVRVIRKKDLEIKFKNDSFVLVQTEKHLKILEKDGMIKRSVLDEYYLEPAGRKVLDDIETLGYLARHHKEAAEWQRIEDEEDEGWVEGDILFTPIYLIDLIKSISPAHLI
jgi:hypothetical protein